MTPPLGNAGYSGTPLPRKLGIKEGAMVCVVHPPADLDALLAPLPPGVSIRTGLRSKGPFDVALLFVSRRADLERDFPRLVARLDQAGGLWVCWPKKSSGVPSELDDRAVREYGLSTGLVDNKVCAVDETWSGLRFVIRVENRA